MTLKARIDNAEAEVNTRLEAEIEAAAHALVTWVDTHTPAEQAAFWRVAKKEYPDGDDSAGFLEICGGTFEVQPGDEERVAAMLSNIPADLAGRLQATKQAAG